MSPLERVEAELLHLCRKDLIPTAQAILHVADAIGVTPSDLEVLCDVLSGRLRLPLTADDSEWLSVPRFEEGELQLSWRSNRVYRYRRHADEPWQAFDRVGSLDAAAGSLKVYPVQLPYAPGDPIPRTIAPFVPGELEFRIEFRVSGYGRTR